MANRGLPRLGGGIMARERAAWASPCRIHANRGDTTRPAAAVIDSPNGPVPICEECISGAEQRKYTIRREPLR
jgi:hypothetical protein